jgi:hypothetical protein
VRDRSHAGALGRLLLAVGSSRFRDIDAVADGEDSIDSLFDSDQERFLEDYGSIGVDFDTLHVLGPAAARVWKIETTRCPPT